MPALRSKRYKGTCFRLFKPHWADPLDTAYSKQRGGRWTPPGEFGAIYLNATIAVASANARAQHAGRAIGLFDLISSRRPMLLEVAVPDSEIADVFSDDGIAAAGFQPDFPYGVAHAACWPTAREAYALKRLAGIASRSNAECGPKYFAGQELSWFDRSPALSPGRTLRFEEWYPGPHP